MKKVFMGSMLVVSVSFMSCGSTDSAEVDKTIMPAESAIPQVNNGAADSSNSVQVINTVGGVGGTQPVIGAAPTKAASAINIKGSSAPNPAQGQPGHRCDI